MTVGETIIIALCVARAPTPHEVVYQLSVVPLPPTAVSVVELPEQILLGVGITAVGATGG